jgi:hypothetical protein
MGEVANPFEGHAPPAPYRCFLLRCWMEEDAGAEGAPVWRFAVRRVGPDVAHRAFASLDDVVAYIAAELATCGRKPRER